MSRPILLHEAQLPPLLDGDGDPITGTNAEKFVSRFTNLRVQHNFGGSSWDVTLEGSIDGINFEVVPGTANMTGDGIVEIPDHWTKFRVVSNVVDTLGSYSLVLGGLEVDEIVLFVNAAGGGATAAQEAIICAGADTGRVSGFAATVNVDPAKADIAAGIGQHADHSTVPSTCQQVSIGPFTAVEPLFGPQPFTTLLVDPDNPTVLIKLSRLITPEERNTRIQLPTIVHEQGTIVEGFAFINNTPLNIGSSLGNLAAAIGALNVFGNVYGPFGTTTRLTRTAGEVYDYTANRVVNPLAPDNPPSIANTTGTLATLEMRTDGAGGFLFAPATGSAIDTVNYDNAGTLTAVPSNRWQIKRVDYVASSDRTIVTYGQVTYNMLNDALAALTDGVLMNPELRRTGVFRAWLVVQQSATDLSVAGGDAEFHEFLGLK